MTSNGSMKGTHLMMRSLIEQLVCKEGEKLDLSSAPTYFWDLNASTTLRGYLEAFKWLVRQLPRSEEVHCVIDGIQHYLKSPFRADMMRIVEVLDEIKRESGEKDAFGKMRANAEKNANFKVLYTSFDSTVQEGWMIGAIDIINIAKP